MKAHPWGKAFLFAACLCLVTVPKAAKQIAGCETSYKSCLCLVFINTFTLDVWFSCTELLPAVFTSYILSSKLQESSSGMARQAELAAKFNGVSLSPRMVERAGWPLTFTLVPVCHCLDLNKALHFPPTSPPSLKAAQMYQVDCIIISGYLVQMA